jgi:diguanylate cyclase (GGDEF)-like protein
MKTPRPILVPRPTSTTPQRFGFAIVAAAAILILATMFAAYGVYDYRATLAAGRESAEQIADQTALATEGTLEATTQLLRSMALLVRPPGHHEAHDAAAVRAALLDLKAHTPYAMDLLIVSPDGRITDWTGAGAPPDIRDREYYTYHARTPNSDLYVGPPLLSKVHAGKWFFAVSEGLRDERGGLSAVVVVVVDVGILQSRLSGLTVVKGSTRALLSPDGKIYARMPDHALHVGKQVSRQKELVALTPANPSFVLDSTSQLDQQRRIIAFHRLSDYPLVAVATIATQELLGPWQERLVIVCALWTLLSIAIIVLASRARAISHAQIKEANLDSLTGIPNRRSIMALASRLERGERSDRELSLLMIDIDHFKSINDEFGHLAGDDVIRLVAHLLQREVRSSDNVGRYGGEEFLVLMPGASAEGAHRVAEKLRLAVAEKLTEPKPVTVSIGVASRSDYDRSLADTLARADAALYRAKALGRNRVVVADEAVSVIAP